jgi:hypothetical protein
MYTARLSEHTNNSFEREWTYTGKKFKNLIEVAKCHGLRVHLAS